MLGGVVLLLMALVVLAVFEWGPLVSSYRRAKDLTKSTLFPTPEINVALGDAGRVYVPMMTPAELVRWTKMPDLVELARVERQEQQRVAAELLIQQEKEEAKQLQDAEIASRNEEFRAIHELEKEKVTLLQKERMDEIRRYEIDLAEDRRKERLNVGMERRREMVAQIEQRQREISELVARRDYAIAQARGAYAAGYMIERDLSYVDGVGVPLWYDHRHLARKHWLYDQYVKFGNEAIQYERQIRAVNSNLQSYGPAAAQLEAEFKLLTSNDNIPPIERD